MDAFADFIKKEIKADRENQVLAKSIFGTEDETVVASLVDLYCREQLKSRVARPLLFEISVGAGVGVELQDRRSVFIKFLTGKQDLGALQSICDFQGFLYDRGFPCPRVLKQPLPFNQSRNVVLTQAFTDVGQYVDTRNPLYRQEMANLLWRLHELASGYMQNHDLSAFKREIIQFERLWPDPHNALFDFSRHADRCGWVDDCARRSLEIIQALQGCDSPLLSHTDWSSKHFRFDEAGKATIIYDWDSIQYLGELSSLAKAAATFPYNWHTGQSSHTPTLAEARGFIADYEQARGAPLTEEQLRYCSAHSAYVIAYICKCRYSLNPDEAEQAEESVLLRETRGGVYFE